MAKNRESDLYRLLVELASFDPDTAREGDWLNYQAGLDEVVHSGNAEVSRGHFHSPPRRPLTVDKEKIRATHLVVQQVVRQFAAGGGVEPVTVTVSIAAIGGARPMLVVLPAPGRLPDADAVALLAAQLLTRPERPPIAVCPEDGRLFVKVRRQQYCSRQCVNKANMRAHHQRQLEKLTKRKKSPKRRA